MHNRALSLGGAACAALLLAACALADPGSDGPSVAIAIAPLDLPQITNAIYTLAVTNEAGETVWTQTIDSDGYGDGAGGVSYVGTCDATDGPDADSVATNVVSLTVDDLVPLAADEWFDPSDPTPLTRSVVCAPNEDAPVNFDISVLRPAQQGFFDVAVTFDDIFCSAKVDCEYASGDPIELLFDAGGARAQTLVWALACAAPAGSDTHVYSTAATITCDNGAGTGDDVVMPLATTGDLGRKGAVVPLVFDHQLTAGAEQLPGYDKLYLTLAVGIDLGQLGQAGAQGCHFDVSATATKGALTLGEVPAERVYPEVVASIPLNGNDGTLLCTRHGLDDDNGVGIAYTAGGKTYDNVLSADFGAGTVAAAPILGELGVDPLNPADSCLTLFGLGKASGPYYIQTDLGARYLYCDNAPGDGGWTLVGEAGVMADAYATWLRADVSVANLATYANEGGVMASASVIDLAVNHATEVRLSNDQTGAAFRWVRWAMDSGRTTATWWNHAAGQATIDGAADDAVTVTGWNGATATCYQNAYGIMPLHEHGGSYPMASFNTAGNTSTGDLCMAVGVQLTGTVSDGFEQNGNGFDNPGSSTDWPNAAYTDVTPSVSVWLR